jgi:hypothetical protein
MRRVRNPWLRGLIAWSLVLLVVAIVVAFDAISSLYDAQQACFFQTTTPCPEPGDPKEVQLAIAFVGIPLVWLTGLVIGIAGWAVTERIGRPRT